ncbi:hypothetical protein LR48_Vigan252s002000 [Vigna angularis]|uniref:Uncharacterized protein n=1 Tax=Phaseolus angularis TaxID=3914 RepID=A0A0L9T6V3_PHAAN|nr:hypothetical protein LR48_Vigan252s002000 [Vigna angularis]
MMARVYLYGESIDVTVGVAIVGELSSGGLRREGFGSWWFCWRRMVAVQRRWNSRDGSCDSSPIELLLLVSWFSSLQVMRMEEMKETRVVMARRRRGLRLSGLYRSCDIIDGEEDGRATVDGRRLRRRLTRAVRMLFKLLKLPPRVKCATE